MNNNDIMMEALTQFVLNLENEREKREFALKQIMKICEDKHVPVSKTFICNDRLTETLSGTTWDGKFVSCEVPKIIGWTIRELIHANKKIQAIKFLKEYAGIGLVPAKVMIEEIKDRN